MNYSACWMTSKRGSKAQDVSTGTFSVLEQKEQECQRIMKKSNWFGCSVIYKCEYLSPIYTSRKLEESEDDDLSFVV